MVRILLISIVLLGGCATDRAPMVLPTDLPDTWHTGQTNPTVPQHWLDTLAVPDLADLISQALATNYSLQQQALQVQITQERVKILRADRLPALNLALSGQRFRPAGNMQLISEQVDVSANVAFELDLWGKLSDAQQEAQLNLAAEEMAFLDAQRRLVARVVSEAFNAKSSARLQQLFQQRLENLAQGLDVIERGYRSGLNEALDVYLAQTTVEQERANIANQRQVSFEATTRLELLVADYPDAQLQLDPALPELAPLPSVGLPSDLLQRRPDVQLAWLDLLAADAALAVAHKNRFPSLDLTGSVRDSDSAVSRLLDGGDLAFTAAASLFQPLFQGGRLKALEAQARMRMQQAEQRYLQTLYAAFAEVENELSRAVSLQDRYDALRAAQSNAEAALNLAFSQYQRGLVNFATVLESQRRAFDAQTAVINLSNQLLQSRVALLLALGGNY